MACEYIGNVSIPIIATCHEWPCSRLVSFVGCGRGGSQPRAAEPSLHSLAVGVTAFTLSNYVILPSSLRPRVTVQTVPMFNDHKLAGPHWLQRFPQSAASTRPSSVPSNHNQLSLNYRVDGIGVSRTTPIKSLRGSGPDSSAHVVKWWRRRSYLNQGLSTC